MDRADVVPWQEENFLTWLNDRFSRSWLQRLQTRCSVECETTAWDEPDFSACFQCRTLGTHMTTHASNKRKITVTFHKCCARFLWLRVHTSFTDWKQGTAADSLCLNISEDCSYTLQPLPPFVTVPSRWDRHNAVSFIFTKLIGSWRHGDTSCHILFLSIKWA